MPPVRKTPSRNAGPLGQPRRSSRQLQRGPPSLPLPSHRAPPGQESGAAYARNSNVQGQPAPDHQTAWNRQSDEHIVSHPREQNEPTLGDRFYLDLRSEESKGDPQLKQILEDLKTATQKLGALERPVDEKTAQEIKDAALDLLAQLPPKDTGSQE